MSIYFGTKLNDSQAGMCMLRKNVLNDITITSDSMPRCEEFKVEVLRNPKVKEKEVSVPYRVSLG